MRSQTNEYQTENVFARTRPSIAPRGVKCIERETKKNCLEQRSEKSADNYVWKKFSDNILNKFAHSNN